MRSVYARDYESFFPKETAGTDTKQRCSESTWNVLSTNLWDLIHLRFDSIILRNCEKMWDFAIFDAIIILLNLTSLFIACHTAIPALSLDVSGEAQQKATRWASMMICFWDDHSSRGRCSLPVLQMAYHTMWAPPSSKMVYKPHQPQL